jgi:hypothetical protein
MPLAPTDPARVALPDDPRDDAESHAYAWYDPDSAAFDVDDPLAELDPLADEDGVAVD